MVVLEFYFEFIGSNWIILIIKMRCLDTYFDRISLVAQWKAPSGVEGQKCNPGKQVEATSEFRQEKMVAQCRMIVVGGLSGKIKWFGYLGFILKVKPI